MAEQIVLEILQFSHHQRTLVHRCVILEKDNISFFKASKLLVNFKIQVDPIASKKHTGHDFSAVTIDFATS